MILVLLLPILLVLINTSRSKSLLFLFSMILVISISGAILMGRDYEVENLGDLFGIFFILLLLLMVVVPWKDYKGVHTISNISPLKIKKLTRILIIINSVVFIIFLITTIIVMTTITDINEFKYGEGVSSDFYYKFLPFNVTFFNFSILAYYSAYFLFPLHFYYLSIKKYKLAFICFILSLNIVLYGLTFFSRAVVVQYSLMYLATIWMLYGSLDYRVKKNIKRVGLILSVLVLLYFINISNKRFKEDRSTTDLYTLAIPSDAIVKDPVLYSYLDYSSQWVYNGFELIKLYDFETFKAQITFQPLLGIAQQFGVISYDPESYAKLRRSLWPNPYGYSFNGYPAYLVYDYGIIGAILFSTIYFWIIRKLRPKNGVIDVYDLFLITLLIQLPLMAIFYSQMANISIALIIAIFLRIYLKYSLK